MANKYDLKIIGILFIILIGAGSVPAKAKQYTVVGTDLPPLMYQQDNQAMGFYVDILQEMVKITKHIDIDIQFYPAPRMFRTLSESKDTFSLGVTRNEKREYLYKWVGPIYPRIFALYKLTSRTDIKIDTLKDVRSYDIGVGRGYAAVDDLLNAQVPPENIQQVTNDAQNVRKLFMQRIDLVIMNDVMLAYNLEHEGHSWSDVEQVFILNDKYEFWYALNKDMDEVIVQQLQRALDKLKKNGVYDDIVKKYFK